MRNLKPLFYTPDPIMSDVVKFLVEYSVNSKGRSCPAGRVLSL